MMIIKLTDRKCIHPCIQISSHHFPSIHHCQLRQTQGKIENNLGKKIFTESLAITRWLHLLFGWKLAVFFSIFTSQLFCIHFCVPVPKTFHKDYCSSSTFPLSFIDTGKIGLQHFIFQTFFSLLLGRFVKPERWLFTKARFPILLEPVFGKGSKYIFYFTNQPELDHTGKMMKWPEPIHTFFSSFLSFISSSFNIKNWQIWYCTRERKIFYWFRCSHCDKV